MKLNVLKRSESYEDRALELSFKEGDQLSIRPSFFAPERRYWQFYDDVRYVRVVTEHELGAGLAPFERKIILSSGHLLLGVAKDEQRFDWYVASPVEAYSPHFMSKLVGDLLTSSRRPFLEYGGDLWRRSEQLKTECPANRRSLIDLKMVEGIETFLREVSGDRPELMFLIASSRVFDFSCTRYVGFQIHMREIHTYP
ncbi:hypothetical protein [Stenotrophomonas sp. S41]|uniref:hypothetical protein n=1 Tax=Stenotrophomonas sp. S41 TaxID=2767464 RepID=UPI00190DC471|nr:hypothetical protein [Stenotrophomonas sp. S41]MBK0010772.1 hypothetical protein [Stenotrophomonas sp. S41]